MCIRDREDEEQLAEFLEEVANTIRDSGFIQAPPENQAAGAAEASGTRGLENSIGDLIAAFRTLMVNPPRAGSDFTPPPYKKELKFKGKLGDTEESSTIGYGTLKAQVRDAKKSKYTDHDIITAIKNIVSPDASLSTLLEADVDLTLDDILKIVCNSQASQGTSTLFRKMITGRQEPNCVP